MNEARSKHTPGPWRMEEWTTPGNFVWAVEGPSVERTIFTDNQADARLIAAAPELLAALEDIADSNNLEGYILPRARAAIARARGGK